MTVAVNVMLPPAVICVTDAEITVTVLIFAGAATVSETSADVDAAKFESPE